MAKINDIKEIFKEVEGIQICENSSGEIQDIIVPESCEIISKSIVDGILREIRFNNGNKFYHFEF